MLQRSSAWDQWVYHGSFQFSGGWGHCEIWHAYQSKERKQGGETQGWSAQESGRHFSLESDAAGAFGVCKSVNIVLDTTNINSGI